MLVEEAEDANTEHWYMGLGRTKEDATAEMIKNFANKLSAGTISAARKQLFPSSSGIRQVIKNREKTVTTNDELKELF